MRRAFWFTVAAAAALAVLAAPATAATLTPNITAEDDGTADCSLREAIDAAVANSDGGGCDTETTGPYGNDVTDEIVLDQDTQYTITIASTNENGNFDGDLDVGGGGPIVIRSSSPGIRRSIAMADIGSDDRMFDLVPINGVADLTLRDVDLGPTNEIPAENGGVIRAVINGNDLDLENVEIVHNDEVNAVDGGLIAVSGASSTFEMSDSTLRGGDATSQGGALYLDDLSPVTIERSVIAANTASAPNGADAEGGGIVAINTDLTITDSEISSNAAAAPGMGDGDARGGGVVTFDDLTIERTLIEGNTAFTSDVGAATEVGGGVYIQTGAGDGPSTIVNSTIAGNEVGNDPANGAGGGIFNLSTQPVEVVHTTFFANAASDPESGDHIQNNGTGLTYANSVLPGGGGVNMCEGGDATTISGGFNALSPDDPDGCDAEGTGDATGVIGIVPGGATANGGPSIGGSDPVPTRTIAILGGTAENLVPTANCGPAGGIDARGVTRPQGTACDAGAFEREIAVTPPVVVPTPATPAPTKKKKCKKKKKKRAAEAKKKKCKKKKQAVSQQV
jgi:CSLREA domain-containing protein